MSENMIMSLFQPMIGQNFEVRPAEMEPVKITLVEVTDMSRAGIDSFSLLFHGPTDTVFPHDTHLITNEQLGEFHLFLGPVASGDNRHISYQAIFNRPVTN